MGNHKVQKRLDDVSIPPGNRRRKSSESVDRGREPISLPVDEGIDVPSLSYLPVSEFQGMNVGIKLLVDNRENINCFPCASLSDFLSQTMPDIHIEITKLELGDFMWAVTFTPSSPGTSAPRGEYLLDFVVERKIISDLMASITDRRYIVSLISHLHDLLGTKVSHTEKRHQEQVLSH